MPTLNWIGKDKVVNHHLDVPFRTPERQYTFAPSGQDGRQYDLHRDNLEALKALLPQYEGRIRKWFEQVVGKEGKYLSLHDKLLCMMYPRLRLLQKLLAEDDVIFISIDNIEIANLKLI